MGLNHTLLVCLLVCLQWVACLPTTTPASFVAISPDPIKEDPAVEPKPPSGVKGVPKIYEMKVESNVSNRFAKTAVISKVKNIGNESQEATFAVVLPDTAYISGFVMEIGGKSYKAYVKEKEEAKQIYDQAVSTGQAAAHVEANARDSNRFTVSVNVEPLSKAVFTLTYEELLQRQNEQYEIVINIHPGQLVKDLSVEVNVNESRPLKFLKSPPLRSGNEISKNDDKLDTQAVIEIVNATTGTVQFRPSIERQKQLINDLGTKEENGLSGQFVVQYDVERDPQGGEVLLKDGYFVHFFAPSELTPLPKQVVFVLDTSGSMYGVRIQQLKEAMNSILAELKREDLFSIVEFESKVNVWNIEKVQVDYQDGSDAYYYPPEEKPLNLSNQELPKTFEASPENIANAKKVVEKLRASGGTNIKSALEIAIKSIKKNLDEKHQPIIIFLTDGEPTVGETTPDKISAEISDLNSGATEIPIFSLSFGDGADRDFLQKLSLKNSGFARHIYEAADASLQLQEFYKQISSPLLSNVHFEYLSNVTKVTKPVFPIYFRGSELVVSGVLDGDFAPPKVLGTGVHGPIELIPRVETPVGDMERIWAYLTVKQILEDRDAAENKTSFTQKALEVALKYSFVTPVSSLVVVKPNDTSAIDTQDASKPSFEPQYHLLSGAAPNYLIAGGAPGAPVPFAPRPAAAFGGSFDFAAYPSTTFRPYLPLATLPPSQIAPESESPDVYKDIKEKLTWLGTSLAHDGTITISGKPFKLSTNETVSVEPECPATPVNGTGICTLLPKCPQVFTYLTSEKEYEKYFCALNEFAGVCCPKQE